MVSLVDMFVYILKHSLLYNKIARITVNTGLVI